MKEQEKTYTEEQVKKIIEESVKQVKMASNFATEKAFTSTSEKLNMTMLSTAIIDGMEKTLKAKFGIKPQKNFTWVKPKENIVKIESKEELKDVIIEIVNAIFAD